MNLKQLQDRADELEGSMKESFDEYQLDLFHEFLSVVEKGILLAIKQGKEEGISVRIKLNQELPDEGELSALS